MSDNFDDSMSRLMAIGCKKEEWSPDVQRLLIQDAQLPDQIPANSMLQIWCHCYLAGSNDAGLKQTRDHVDLCAKAGELFIDNVRQMRAHHFVWEYLYDLGTNVLPPACCGAFKHWVHLAHCTLEPHNVTTQSQCVFEGTWHAAVNTPTQQLETMSIKSKEAFLHLSCVLHCEGKDAFVHSFESYINGLFYGEIEVPEQEVLLSRLYDKIQQKLSDIQSAQSSGENCKVNHQKHWIWRKKR